MKAIILNASPRKNWNTAQLLKAAQQGAAVARALLRPGSREIFSNTLIKGLTNFAKCFIIEPAGYYEKP